MRLNVSGGIIYLCIFSHFTNHMQVPSATRAAPNYSLRLPQGWKATSDMTNNGISQGDLHWVGKALFASKGTLQSTLQLWYHPLPPPSSRVPNPEAYHRRSLFLWMLKRMWGIAFTCPRCVAPHPLR